MGKVRTNVAFKAFRNKIDGIVYYERYGEPCLRVPVKAIDPRTPKQRKVREALRRVAALWKQLDGIVKESWQAQGKRRQLSGYAAFVAENAVRQREGRELCLCREYGIEALAEFTAKAGSAAGSIDCEYSSGERADDPRVYLFTRRVEKGLAGGELRRFEGGAVSGGSCTLTGLEAGAEYHVHALLTDTLYEEATVVSGSSSAVCRAKE